MAASVARYSPVVRGEGKAVFPPLALWCDAVLLVASTSQTYTLPTGTDPVTGGSLRASILRITDMKATAGPTYFVLGAGPAAVPAASTSTGGAPYGIPSGGVLLLQIPAGATQLSFITAGAGNILIEAWW